MDEDGRRLVRDRARRRRERARELGCDITERHGRWHVSQVSDGSTAPGLPEEGVEDVAEVDEYLERAE